MSEKSFKQDITLFDATMMVVGIMIGSGIFIVSADIARTVGSAGMLLAVWGITGLLTLIGALSYGELGGMFPHAGGQYVYLREAFNRLVAFLYGWTFFMVIQTGSIAAVGVAFAKYLAVLVPALDESHTLADVGFMKISISQFVAISLIVFLTWVNTGGIRLGKLIQNTFTFAKIISLVGVILLALVVGYNSDAVAANWSNFWAGSRTILNDDGSIQQVIQLSGYSLLAALAVSQVGSLFSSDGWNNITFAAPEVINPKKNIPLALAFGTVIVTALYLSINLAYVVTLPVQGTPGTGVFAQGIQFASSDRVGAASVEMMLPGIGAQVMAVLIMISTFGCSNGMILAGARCYYAMAKDKLFFTKVGTLNKNSVPGVALWTQCLWACTLCLSGRYGDLLDYVVFAVLLFYIATIVGIFVLRSKRPDAERPIKAIGYPVIPALYIAIATFICLVLLDQKPNYTYPGLGIVLLGVPVYYIWSRKASAVAE
ncbi:MAG: APC family permease [Candidatus Kapaibacterium sp.]|jgi:APA family basic amino acid/polyamine antiporter